jgi:DNA-binding SARP family transcriptional activator
MTLLIRLFGSLSVELDGVRLSAGIGRNVRGLLAFLALHRPQLHQRESIAEVFWPDADRDQARRSLNTTLWRLRRLIEPHSVKRGTHLVSTAHGEIGLRNLDVVWVDITEFEAVVKVGLAANGRLAEQEDRVLSTALELYVADAFDGFYHDWAVRERERLRCLYIEGLRKHMEYLSARGDYAGAISCGARILNQDPLQEVVHRDLIRLHLERGNRSLAERQYEACEDVLRSELGVRPNLATLEVGASLRAGPKQPYLAELVRLKEVLSDMRRFLNAADQRIELLLGSVR